MARLACIRCAAFRLDARCPTCKHLTHDLDTDGGQAALAKAIRQRTMGAGLLVVGGGIAGCLICGLFASGGSIGNGSLACTELGLLSSTPLLVAGFAFGFRFGPLRKLRAQTTAHRRRRWQRDDGPTRF